MNLIEVSDLHVRYGAYEAVKGASFALGKGEILGIVGESGSGKSTIAKTLMGLTQSSGGSIAWGRGKREGRNERPDDLPGCGRVAEPEDDREADAGGSAEDQGQQAYDNK